MSSALVSLRSLTLAYGDVVAVAGLNLEIAEGELLVLLGPSGCGKTTTMRAIAGLVTPVAGTVMVAGRDVTHASPNQRDVGMVFQSYALFPHLSAFENVAFGLRLQHRSGHEINERVTAELATVGLAAFHDRRPGDLSGGQQQRLALARSMVLRPKVLLLDEPLSNLDARLRLEMRAELLRVQRATGVTMVFVTHDQAEALALADRIVLMKDGRIEQIGTPEDLYNRPATRFAADFLGFENIFQYADGQLISEHGELPVLSGAGLSPGTHLAWRPAQVRVGEGPHAGTVVSSSFAGEQREYVLDTAVGLVKAAAPAAHPAAAVGGRLEFDLRVEDACRLTGDSDGGGAGESDGSPRNRT